MFTKSFVFAGEWFGLWSSGAKLCGLILISTVIFLIIIPDVFSLECVPLWALWPVPVFSHRGHQLDRSSILLVMFWLRCMGWSYFVLVCEFLSFLVYNAPLATFRFLCKKCQPRQKAFFFFPSVWESRTSILGKLTESLL